MKIYKYIIHPYEPVPLPDGAKILSVGAQGRDIFLWAFVDPDKPPTPRYVHVFCTGEEIAQRLMDPSVAQFLGTVFCPNGLVFHLFEEFVRN